MLSSTIGFAQKAYEAVYYKGKVNGMIVKLSFADGYLAASKITLTPKNKKAKSFIPEKGVADANGQLKFLHYINPLQPAVAYFILYRLKDSAEVLSAEISGKYNDSKKQYSIIIKKENKP